MKNDQLIKTIGQNLKAGRKQVGTAMKLVAFGSFVPLIIMFSLPPSLVNERTVPGVLILLLNMGFGSLVLGTLMFHHYKRLGWSRCLNYPTHRESSSIAIMASLAGFPYMLMFICSIIELGLVITS